MFAIKISKLKITAVLPQNRVKINQFIAEECKCQGGVTCIGQASWEYGNYTVHI